jgi:uncharacterized tellurite resistance protein B-like protein
MAFADGEVSGDEVARIESMCDDFELSEGSREQVLESAEHPLAAELGVILARLRTSELRFALLVDLVDIAAADGVVAAGEEAELESLAEELDITHGQLAMTRRYVLELRDTDTEGASPETIAGLASVGVPAAALAVLAPLGAPLAAGIGVAAALGVGSFFSVRWLLRKVRRKSGEDKSGASE